MSQRSPYLAACALVAGPNSAILKRPVLVTIALALLWILLAFKALGSMAQLRTVSSWSEPGSAAYVAYLAVMVLVPAFLLVNIARASNRARITLLTLYALNFLFRIFLFVNDGQFTVSATAWLIGPAFAEAGTLAFLFLPRSSRWFAARPDISLERARAG